MTWGHKGHRWYETLGILCHWRYETIWTREQWGLRTTGETRTLGTWCSWRRDISGNTRLFEIGGHWKDERWRHEDTWDTRPQGRWRHKVIEAGRHRGHEAIKDTTQENTDDTRILNKAGRNTRLLQIIRHRGHEDTEQGWQGHDSYRH